MEGEFHFYENNGYESNIAKGKVTPLTHLLWSVIYKHIKAK